MTDHDLADDVEERFQVLENKFQHQEYTVDELNSVVTRQQDQIDALTAELRKIRTLIAEEVGRTIAAGHPVLTVFARADSPAGVEGQLRQRLKRLEHQLLPTALLATSSRR